MRYNKKVTKYFLVTCKQSKNIKKLVGHIFRDVWLLSGRKTI